jgi:hypothetical protein
LRVPSSKPKMASGEQVDNDCRRPVEHTNGSQCQGVDPTSIHTIEPKTDIPLGSPLGGLPPEIRNRIYWYTSVQSAPIHLAAALHDEAAASKLSKFGVPPIAQTNKQFRHECLGVYYGMNSFVFMFNASTQSSEEGSILALWDIIDIIGHSIKMIQSEAFEIRFTSTRNLTFFMLQEIVLCIQSAHLNGPCPTKNLGNRMIKTTADRNIENSALVLPVVNELFELSEELCFEPCTCEEHARRTGVNGRSIERRVRVMDCSHCRQYELERLIFCQKRHSVYSKVGRLMLKGGLEGQRVRIREIIWQSFRHES